MVNVLYDKETEVKRKRRPSTYIRHKTSGGQRILNPCFSDKRMTMGAKTIITIKEIRNMLVVIPKTKAAFILR